MRKAGLIVALAALSAASQATAAVKSVEVPERMPFAAGASFGAAGPYEKIRGVARSATAVIDPDTVLVSGPVADPAHVRFNWSNVAAGRLYNRQGLPASTFTAKLAGQ